MPVFTHSRWLIFLFLLPTALLFSQDVTITYQNPDGLYVCGTDQISVTVKNTGAVAVTTLQVKAALPGGVLYEAGSVTGGGATEANISNLNMPVFAVPDLAAGAQAAFTLTVSAGCSLVDAINGGQLFTNTITATFNGGSSEAVTTSPYAIETGLLIIVSATPAMLMGVKGDMLMRTITVRNTRQGPISALQFEDSHLAGLDFSLNGVGGTNVSGTFFQADVPGSYFTAFGDGDALLEFNETVTLTEKITITGCGTPQLDNESVIRVGWGCGSSICRQDSIEATVTIKTSPDNPSLSFVPKFAPAINICGLEPSTQQMTIHNTGNLSATDVVVQLLSSDSLLLGIDYNSIEINTGSGWQPIVPLDGITTNLVGCGISTYYKVVKVNVPEVPEGDSVQLRFNTYYCVAACSNKAATVRGTYLYHKACPPTAVISGAFKYEPDTLRYNVKSGVYYDIGVCLEDGQSYSFDYWVKSGRLTLDTGVLKVAMFLPWGIFPDPNCAPKLDGQTPMIELDTFPGTGVSYTLIYDLPFSADSLGASFCLKYICSPDIVCSPPAPNVPPRGMDWTVFPSAPGCSDCILQASAMSSIVSNPGVNPNCGVSYCDVFKLVINNHCDTSGGGGGGSGSGGGGGLAGLNLASSTYTVYRTNLGLRDNDDNRQADNNLPANSPQIRRDRFLPGDTLRHDFRVVVDTGVLTNIHFRLFLESWQSDFGWQDGDGYLLGAGKPLFVNYDTTFFLAGNVRIKVATTGAEYSCPIDAGVKSDQHQITFAEPNIRPEQILDVETSMFHQFDISTDDLAASGCVPSGFVLHQGDSLLFTADFKFESNFVPLPASSVPPLINFRTNLCDTDHNYAWKSAGCTDSILLQYSGYREVLEPGKFGIRPCDPSSEIFPFTYEMRIARGNLFPFEVRPLASVLSYSQLMPDVVPLLNAKLLFLRLQENVNFLADVPLTPSLVGNTFSLNLSSIFDDPLDEGWIMRLSEQFGNTCNYSGNNFATTNFRVQYPNMCFHNPVVAQYNLDNPAGYISGSPVLDITVTDSLLDLPTSDLSADFSLKNITGNNSPYTWLAITTDGQVSDIELFLLPGMTPVPVVNGVYQIGGLGPFQQGQFHLTARNLSCEEVHITLTYGWECDPVTGIPDSAEACGYYIQNITLRPLEPELELVIVSQPQSVPLCEPSPYFEFEIYNANDGYAYGIEASVKLPPGFSIVPNSSQLSYPVGTGFVPLGNPTQLPGNVYLWKPAQTSAALAQDGLKGVTEEPENTLRIRFKVQPECGAVSNAQPIYGAESVKPCGISSNILRKPGQPLLIEGLGPSYTVDASLDVTQPADGCGDEITMTAMLTLNDLAAPGDSVYVLLPQGISYVSGSYQAGPNAPAGPPKVTGNQFQVALPTNLQAGATLTFTFKVRYNEAAGCVDQTIVLQTREQSASFCPLTGTNCAVFVATGEVLALLSLPNPDLQLQNVNLTLENGEYSFTGILENQGDGAANEATVQFYLDTNGNGQVDPGDELVTTVMGSGSIPAGNSGPILGSLGNLTPAQVCQLLALVPGQANCACADHVYPLPGATIQHFAAGQCGVTPVAISVDSTTNAMYAWTPADLVTCPTCASTTYNPGPNVQPGDMVTLAVDEVIGTGCTIHHEFTVQFGGTLGVETPDQTICEGDVAQLEATPGGTYNWSGPGISDPAAQVQLVQPTATTTYSVTVTFSGGCTGSDNVQVTVLQRDTIDLGTVTTCAGVPVDMFGTLTDVPGTYYQTLPDPNGCDDALIRHLVNIPTQTGETLPLCPAESVIVFDTLRFAPGVFCKTSPSSIGCDSTHCITVQSVPNPVLMPNAFTDTLQIGNSVLLDGIPDNFAGYMWSPADSLSCADCPTPIASPDTSITYSVRVTDENGCHAEASYSLVLFPMCDGGRLLLPNAFTPDGDGKNDVFRVVPFEGLETIVSLEIYNRWGQKVFSGGGNNLSWDGKVDGTPAPSETYIYIMVAECPGGRSQMVGDVTLLR